MGAAGSGRPVPTRFPPRADALRGSITSNCANHVAHGAARAACGCLVRQILRGWYWGVVVNLDQLLR
eukprot:568816-Pleurochrysis_carterae.AAC.1